MPAPLPLYSVLPFVAMLLAIALLPLALPHWWDSDRNKLGMAAALGAPVFVLYLVREPAALVHTATDYVSFIVLLASLYVITGGMLLRGDLEARPLVNTAFLAVGAGLASVVGTTGASMLLIRALLQTNRERARVVHSVIFFIFLVSNIGGLLTPLGDPPLFLGHLAGVPFTWTFRLWLPWLVMTGTLLVVYFVWDSIEYARETETSRRRDRALIEPLSLHGTLNAIWLVGVVAAVAFLRAPAREIILVVLAGLSLWRTPREIRRANRFTAHPMIEVAVLFFGIFLTMMPALELLHRRGAELDVREPWHFFWATGGMSSFLDNAPTYLAFLALAQGLGLPPAVVGVPESILAAISVGAVAMGANTYIGNAPNFMVKAIAEEAGVRMPSFFGYMAYSAVVLLPLFVVVTLLFF
ncbi:MAG TPA: sodium:proton antiporter [Methylomirabilota bacterium]|jgi:Na+/H+ antiporter NhaD/arsenite permease-like protein